MGAHAGVLASGARDISQAAARDCRRLSKPRAIGLDEVVRLWDEREMIDGKKAAAAASKKKQETAKRLAAGTKSRRPGGVSFV